MDDQFRIPLNEKFDGLRADELAPDFDRSETWAAIERQLPAPRQRRRLLPVWTIAAAAALAGLIVGGATVRLLNSSAGPAPTIAHRFAAAEVVPTAPAAVAIRQRQAMVVAAKPTGTRPHSFIRSATPAQPATLPAPAEQSLIPATDTRPAIVVRPATPQRAVHLLDIDAGSRTALLNNRASAPEKQSVAEFMMVRTAPGASQPEAPAAILPLFH